VLGSVEFIGHRAQPMYVMCICSTSKQWRTTRFFPKPPHGVRASGPGGDGGGDESTHLRRTEGCSAGGAR